MGNLMYIKEYFSEAKEVGNIFPFLFILILGSIAALLIFGSNINNISGENDFGYKSSFIFFRYSIQFGIYMGIGTTLLILSGFLSLLSGQNYVKKLFTKINCKIFPIRCFHYLIYIALIDILYNLFFIQLVTSFSKTYLITNYFNESIYLFYIIFYYRKFKKADFKLKQIIYSYIFFILGIISMIIGLTNYYCLTEEKIGNRDKYNNWSREKEEYTYYVCDNKINYFVNNHISIIIAIFIIPFLFFIKIFYSKKYMDITNNNALVINFQIYFIKFIFSLILYLIVIKLIYKTNYLDNYETNLNYGLYALISDIYDLIFFIILRVTNLFFVFIILVFRKLLFHVSMAKTGNGKYHIFLVGSIIMNIFGLVSFSCNSDNNLLEEFQKPLFEEENNGIKSDLIINENSENSENNENNENKITNENNTSTYGKPTLNISTNNDYILSEITPEGKENETYDAAPFEDNGLKKKNEEIENLQSEIKKLKSENNELKSQNQSQNIKIRTLQVRIQNLEELNEKLSEKIAILTEKGNTNMNGDE